MNRPAIPRRSILYTGAFRFPEGDAAAFRVHAVANLFASLGHRVDFAGWEAGDEVYEWRGHRCFPQNEFRSGPQNPIVRLFGFIMRGRRTLGWLWNRSEYDVVIAYNPPALFAALLVFWGRLRKVAIVLDSTEWYDGSHLPGGRFGLAALENAARMYLVYRLFDHAIVISTFLAAHFRRISTLRLPPLQAWPASIGMRNDLRSGIRLVYAGEAGRKDSLGKIVAALPKLSIALGIAVELHVAGMSLPELQSLLVERGFGDAKPEGVHCYGRVSRELVLELYGQCHFSVLFRDDLRYARAGFPTKAMESWSKGCPIITNRVGDLRGLATHLKNAIVIEESELEIVLPSIVKEIIKNEMFDHMCRDSAETAARTFEAEAYSTKAADFLRALPHSTQGGGNDA